MSDSNFQGGRTHKRKQSLCLICLLCFVIGILVAIQFYLILIWVLWTKMWKEGDFYLSRFLNPIDKTEIIKEQTLFTKAH